MDKKKGPPSSVEVFQNRKSKRGGSADRSAKELKDVEQQDPDLKSTIYKMAANIQEMHDRMTSNPPSYDQSCDPSKTVPFFSPEFAEKFGKKMGEQAY